MNNGVPVESSKPEKLECPNCKKKTDWEIDIYDGDWVLKGEWWQNQSSSYLCSKKCYLATGGE